MSIKIEPSLDDAKIITQPMVRNFSTGGGHGPGDTMIEGDGKIVTQKWQGHPPVDLTIIGKPQAPLREVVEPRYRGTAEFATRIRLPGMLYAKFLRSPYPRAAIRQSRHRHGREDAGRASHPHLPQCAQDQSAAHRADAAGRDRRDRRGGDRGSGRGRGRGDRGRLPRPAVGARLSPPPNPTTRPISARARAISCRCRPTAPIIMPSASGALASRRRREGLRRIRHRARVLLLLRRQPHRPDAALQRRRASGRATSSPSGATGRTSIRRASTWPAGSASTRTTSISSTNGTAAPSAASACAPRRSGGWSRISPRSPDGRSRRC